MNFCNFDIIWNRHHEFAIVPRLIAFVSTHFPAPSLTAWKKKKLTKNIVELKLRFSGKAWWHEELFKMCREKLIYGAIELSGKAIFLSVACAVLWAMNIGFWVFDIVAILRNVWKLETGRKQEQQLFWKKLWWWNLKSFGILTYF